MVNLQKLALAVKMKRGESSLADVADEITQRFGQISFSTISLVENEKTVPTLDNYAKLCLWLGLSLDYFVIRPEKRAA